MKILEDAFRQAKKARLEILETITKTIKEPRSELSPFAPRVYSLKVNPSKIGMIIGPGGKTINEITEETGASIDIEDDGTVFITCDDAEMAKKAIGRVKALTKEAKIGEIYQGKVVKITDFGAFIELYPKQDGLLHISELGRNIKRVDEVLREGSFVGVKIKNIDDNGKISLVLEKKKV